MRYDIDKIKSSISIHELLVRRGFEVATNKRMIRSPLREEKTPSFSIYEEGKRFHDFGSGAGGDVIDLEMELTGCNKGDAIASLASIAGLSGEEDYHDLSPIPPPPKHHPVRQLGAFIDPAVAKEMRHRLKRMLPNPEESCCKTLAWLRPEDLPAVLKKGFLGADYRGRLTYLMRRGIKVRNDPKASRGDRWIEGSAKDNALFSWQPKDMAPGPETVLFCEGESDSMAAIARWDEHVRVVGCLSCSIAPPMEILYAVARNCNRAVIAFDGDEAGRTGSKAMVALLQRIFPHMKILNYRTPNNMDLKKMYLDGSISILDPIVSGN
jgi:DNA primase